LRDTSYLFRSVVVVWYLDAINNRSMSTFLMVERFL
jgi:hypothetical protein